jgi:hypothetical protein
MPTVTVLGAGHQTISLSFDSAANARIAAQLAASITRRVENRSIIPIDDNGSLPPPLPPGKTGEFRPASSSRRAAVSPVCHSATTTWSSPRATLPCAAPAMPTRWRWPAVAI